RLTRFAQEARPGAPSPSGPEAQENALQRLDGAGPVQPLQVEEDPQPVLLLANHPAPRDHVVDPVDDLVVPYRLGDALGAYGLPLLGQDQLPDQGIGLVAHEDAAELG